jgi:hypothetical protein
MRELHELALAKQVKEIVDIGTDESVAPREAFISFGIKFISLGPATPVTISREFGRARFGLHYTPWSLATKSGIYGALVSHGVMPVSCHNHDTYPLKAGDSKSCLGAVVVGPKAWAQTAKTPNALVKFQADIALARDRYKDSVTQAHQILNQLTEVALLRVRG